MRERGMWVRVWVCLWCWWAAALGGSGGGGSLECYGYPSPVSIRPLGDQLVRAGAGAELRLTCLVQEGLDVSRAYFTNNSLSSPVTPEALVTRLNGSALQLYVPNPQRHATTYYCKYANHWCNSRVTVDSDPLPVTDFKCRSYNLENLTCFWTHQHYARTNFSLEVMLNGLMPRELCNVTFLNGTYSCTFRELSGETHMDFLLSIVNHFGSRNQTFHINQHEVVIPAKPLNLTFTNVTEDGVELWWSLDNNLIMLDGAVVHRVLYQSSAVDGLGTWHAAAAPGCGARARLVRDTLYTCALRRLPYAHWRYEVRVYVRAALAPDEPAFWSDYAYNATLRTRATPPARPPALAAGGFDHLASGNSTQRRDVYVYWRELRKYEQNGDNFTYRVTVRQEGRARVLYPQQSLSYVEVPQASMGAMQVEVRAANAAGESAPAHLLVPAHALLLPPQPATFTTVIYDDDTYELSWQRPPLAAPFDNYTLFWCYNDSPNLCKTGGTDFETLPSDRTNHTIRLVPPETSKKYQFAIAVNQGWTTTGMTWANCKLANGRIAVKTRIERDEVGARFVTFHWTLDCKYREGDILGYNVTYCPLSQSFACDPARLASLFRPQELPPRLNLTGLQPYTIYRVTVTVKSIHGFAAGDNSMNVTTLQDRPSAPEDVRVLRVGGAWAAVAWRAPAHRYGRIVKYVVSAQAAGGAASQLELQQLRAEHVAANATLQQLRAFTNYSVSVRACNGLGDSFCSLPSAPVAFRTAIGAPAKIAKPSMEGGGEGGGAGGGTRRLSWAPPEPAGGTLDRYQVRYNRSDREDADVYNVSDTHYDVAWCRFKGVQSESFQVRAVNLDEDPLHGVRVYAGAAEEEAVGGDGTAPEHAGPWSDALTNKCPNNSDGYVLWTSGSMLCLAVIAVVVYGSWKAWVRFKEMADLKPVLPPSMEDVIEKDKHGKGCGARSAGRGAVPPSRDEQRAVGADEALLLPAPPAPPTPPTPPTRPTHAARAAPRPPSPPRTPATLAYSDVAPDADDATSPPSTAITLKKDPRTGYVLSPVFTAPKPGGGAGAAPSKPRMPSGYLRVTDGRGRAPAPAESAPEPEPASPPAPAPAKKPEARGGYVCVERLGAKLAAGSAPAPPAAPLAAPHQYCRFGWSDDPAADNLHALLAPPTPRPH